MHEDLLRIDEIMKILSLSRSFTYRLLQRGDIPTIRIGRTVRVRRGDLEKFILMNSSEMRTKDAPHQETADSNK